MPPAEDSPGGGPAQQGSLLRRPSFLALVLLGVIVLAAAVGGFAFLQRHRAEAASITQLRPSGIPGNVSTQTASLMGLSPSASAPAPSFTLTDQLGHTRSLSSFRGQTVVLEFMDPHCTDVCPIVSHEFVDAYHDLGRKARHIVFAAVNVNRYHLSIAAVAAFSRAESLDTIPTWHFFTGKLAELRRVWASYGITVQARGPNGDVIHSSVIFFIGPNGKERFVAAPIVDHTASGKAYLPPAQLASWGQGIATVAADVSG